MSAYIVEDETINRIISFLWFEPSASSARRELGALGVNLTTDADLAELGRKMAELNEESIRQRYGEGAVEEMGGGKYRFAYIPCGPKSRVQVYKSLRCFTYQSCEGDCDETPLYKALDRIEKHLAAQIVSALPAYEAAKWG